MIKYTLSIFLAFLCSSPFPLFSQEIDQAPLPLHQANDTLEMDHELECRIKHNKKEPQDLVDGQEVEPVLAAECEPLTTIAGCVNVCSGRFFQIEKDLTSEAIESLALIRTYDSGSKSESSCSWAMDQSEFIANMSEFRKSIAAGWIFQPRRLICSKRKLSPMATNFFSLINLFMANCA
jgi:hypothetical protein